MSEQSLPPYQPLREDWQSALAVVAHPDDMEYGAAAAIARWTSQGKRIGYVMVTSGEAGIDSLTPEECRPLREAEQIASAALVGVDDVDFLGHPDGVVEYGIALRRDIARVVRKYRPDIVITTNFRDSYGGNVPNQADHIAVGRATLDGVRDAGNRWIFTELGDEGLAPWNGVREVWAAASPEARHAVDTTGFLDRGIASLKAHKAYLDGLGGGMADPDTFLEEASRAAGSRLGVTYASPFEVISLRP
ncbi:PIG-L deacetylase family protein [Saccharothrix sp. ST-888]|uniref:PIG-L deacetylase family protein n=1 Tax=Saccharothrix sp. ST-888 TaxID=1427391 RepID=UPI0005ECB9CA|nr:PIG-L deacetylase family protein [Saccharothrix sp. ST-888]KJK58066.1 GlcNAc-PI de-N-acetylase [Saccharothrix sp. ST-888]